MRAVAADYEDLERLVDRCRRGDDRAWSQLVDRFQSLVYSIPRRYGLGEDDCADVFSTTFGMLLQNLDRIQQARAIPKWLATTASREALRVKRITGRSEPTDLPLDEMLQSEEASAEANAVEADLAHRLRSVLAEIPERCQRLLTLLYFVDDASYEDISAQLAMPMGAIGPTRARCLDKMRKLLESRKFFDEGTY